MSLRRKCTYPGFKPGHARTVLLESGQSAIRPVTDINMRLMQDHEKRDPNKVSTFGVGRRFDLMDELQIGKIVNVHLVLERHNDLIPPQLHTCRNNMCVRFIYPQNSRWRMTNLSRRI